MSNKKLVWIVENEDGSIRSNINTGTRIYTKKHNALNRLNTRTNNEVVEYELVPTGAKYSPEWRVYNE